MGGVDLNLICTRTYMQRRLRRFVTRSISRQCGLVASNRSAGLLPGSQWIYVSAAGEDDGGDVTPQHTQRKKQGVPKQQRARAGAGGP